MNLRFVEAFYWVVTFKSVTRAAEKLCLTQSAMSSRVAALEEELGVLLLDRRDRRFRLTVAGIRFAAYAERLLEMQREIRLEMGAVQGQAVSLRLGTIDSVLHAWLVPAVERLRAEHEGLEFQLSVETTPVLLEQARRGTLDLIFAAQPAVADGLRSRPLAPMEMVLVGNAGIHRKTRYRPQDIVELDLLTFQRGSQPHIDLLDMFRQADLEPRRVHTMSSISAMTQLAESGFGVATLPRAAAEKLNAAGRLKVLRFEPALPSLPIHASYRADPGSDVIENVAQAVFAFIEQQQATVRPRGRRPG
ncbi:LysR family transcriptional regulator [Xylophilus sp. GOD-11R]|uniref:LysR family transcriptional regulator n=1 Tax=Xylophilus sp. GOD-11R TaxID=3089814 RepID=UPI00298CB3EF|nr:LysR substrate-binding domain-containing protein [Xylophilus sp. GOD-11R]WPB55962.1 LysR substrate-binding domain-containing protein [Xylophilus sp. GOD-11R]